MLNKNEGSTSSGDFANSTDYTAALLIKSPYRRKKKALVWLKKFCCALKVMVWQLSDKRVHSCIAQSNASRRLVAASAGNVPQLIQTIITLHAQYYARYR